MNVPALGLTPEAAPNADGCGGAASLENRLGKQCLPGGRGFPKQRELLYKGNCLIDMAAGLSGELSSKGWSIDFEAGTHAGPEAGGG